MSLQERTALIKTASGSEKADLAIVNGTLVNVYTGELLEGYGVAVKGERIAYTGKDVGRTIGPDTEVVLREISCSRFIDTCPCVFIALRAGSVRMRRHNHRCYRVD